METLPMIGIFIAIVLLIVFVSRYIIKDKYILTDMQKASVQMTIPSAQLAKTSTPTNNFTYSMWLYVNDWNYNYGYYKPIFTRNIGSAAVDGAFVNTVVKSVNENTKLLDTGEIFPSPMVIFGAERNRILLFITDANNKVFQCDVENIPIQAWINVTFVLYNRTLDIYVNGKLAKTCVMPVLPKSMANTSTSNDVVLTSVAGNAAGGTNNAGFDGYISKFQYFPQAFNPQEVWNIYAKGYGNLSSTLGIYKLQLTLIENGNAIKSLVI